MNNIKGIITLSVFFLIFTFIQSDAFSQGRGNGKTKNKSHVKKETGPPPWAPAHGYRAKTRYVYFTEHNFYYDNTRGVYIYLSGRNWEISASIPSIFKNVNLSGAVKIDLDFEADDPQKYNADHRKKYRKS